MNVVFDAADDDGLAGKVGQNAAKVAMQLFADGVVAQKGSAIFRGEHGVNQNLCEGLRHDGMMGKAGS